MALQHHLVSYRLVRINDDATGQTVYGLLERVQPGSPHFRGWGALLVRPHSAGHTIYQAPHVGSVLRLSLPPYNRAQQPLSYGPNAIG